MKPVGLGRGGAFQYQQVAERIRDQIASGELELGEKLDPVRTIAQRDSVSPYTVFKAIEQLEAEGYLKRVDRQGVFVRSLQSEVERSVHVGVLVPVMPSRLKGSSWLQNNIDRISDHLRERGFQVSAHDCIWRPKADNVRRYIPAESFGRRGVEAMIAAGIYGVHYISALSQLRIPIVAYDVDASDMGVDSAFVDHVEASFGVTRALIDRGHRKIVYVGGPRSKPFGEVSMRFDPAAIERADGYRLAMKTFLPDASVQMFHNKATRSSPDSQQTAERALKEVPDCTAMVLDGDVDLVALGAENIEKGLFRSVHASTEGAAVIAHVDFAEMARLAVELLAERIENPARRTQRRMVEPRIWLKE